LQITKEQLDIPINELEPEATNTETFRDFIRSSENEFCMEPRDIDNMTDQELNEYIDFLDYLWDK
jgi:hypothetical protein